MRIYTDEKDRLLAIWLSAEENDDAAVMAALHPVIVQYKSMKYQPVIYRSGDGNLKENTAGQSRRRSRVQVPSRSPRLCKSASEAFALKVIMLCLPFLQLSIDNG